MPGNNYVHLVNASQWKLGIIPLLKCSVADLCSFETELVPQWHQDQYTHICIYQTSMNSRSYGCSCRMDTEELVLSLEAVPAELIWILFTVQYQTCCPNVHCILVYISESSYNFTVYQLGNNKCSCHKFTTLCDNCFVRYQCLILCCAHVHRKCLHFPLW